MPGTEEVLFNGGLYHDSCLNGILRGAELREQRKRLSRGGRGREPPQGRAVRVLAPLGPQSPALSTLFIGMACVLSAWEQGGRWPFQNTAPLGLSHALCLPTGSHPGAPKALLTLSCPSNHFPTNIIWETDTRRIQGLPIVTPEGDGRCQLSGGVPGPPPCASLPSTVLSDLMWALRMGRSGSIYTTKTSKYYNPEWTVKHLLSPPQELGNEAVARVKVRLALGGGWGSRCGGREGYHTGVREELGELPKLLAGVTSGERTGW